MSNKHITDWLSSWKELDDNGKWVDKMSAITPNETEGSCKCTFCEDNKRWRKIKPTLSPPAIEFVEKIRHELMVAEDELGRAKSIINGTWPNADEIIAAERK